MTLALTGNKPEFVSLLLENGVSLREFLQDDDTLCELYKQLPNCFFLYKLARRVKSNSGSSRKGLGRRSCAHPGIKISLTPVSDEVRHLLGKFTKPIYRSTSTTEKHIDISIEETSLSVSIIFLNFIQG